MQNLKIKVNNEAESKEAQELLFELGYKWHGKVKTVSYLNDVTNGEFGYLVAWSTGCFTNVIQIGCGSEDAKEITLAELRAMVKPKMKEYLMPNRNYEYILTDAREALEPHAKDWISIPVGAEVLSTNGDGNGLIFWKDDFNLVIGLDDHWDKVCQNFNYFHSKYPRCKILWQRQTQPEALPFIDDEPQSLNDQYAEIEQVRQAIKVKSGSDSDHIADAMAYGFIGVGAANGGAKDNVNHPIHYTQGKVECIDALESATIGKSGIEAVCVANIIKYLWRYEEKNGLEDIKKAQFYLNRLIDTLENNNG